MVLAAVHVPHRVEAPEFDSVAGTPLELDEAERHGVVETVPSERRRALRHWGVGGTPWAGSGHTPGWFHDPWGVAPCRSWEGSSWTSTIWTPSSVPTRGGRPEVRAVLIVTSMILWAWGGIWIFLSPALLLSDADNGRFAHDLRLVWLPKVALAVMGAVACLVILRYESNRPPRLEVACRAGHLGDGDSRARHPRVLECRPIGPTTILRPRATPTCRGRGR